MAGRLFRPLYQEYNLKPQNLSRALEDAEPCSESCPYSTGAGFTEGMLGVSAFGSTAPLPSLMDQSPGGYLDCRPGEKHAASGPEGKGQNLRSAALLQFCRV